MLLRVDLVVQVRDVLLLHLVANTSRDRLTSLDQLSIRLLRCVGTRVHHLGVLVGFTGATLLLARDALGRLTYLGLPLVLGGRVVHMVAVLGMVIS